MLHFGNPAPFSFDKFIQLCQDLIPEDDIKIIQAAYEDKDYAHKVVQPTLRKWYIFEIALRNELVKIRANKTHRDPLKYIRYTDDIEPIISRIAVNISRAPLIIEAERMLDQARWQMLDDFAIGHYFDLDYLIVYAYQLLILERWDRVRLADKPRLLKETLASINS
jgi:hypothetical protein